MQKFFSLLVLPLVDFWWNFRKSYWCLIEGLIFFGRFPCFWETVFLSESWLSTVTPDFSTTSVSYNDTTQLTFIITWHANSFVYVFVYLCSSLFFLFIFVYLFIFLYVFCLYQHYYLYPLTNIGLSFPSKFFLSLFSSPFSPTTRRWIKGDSTLGGQGDCSTPALIDVYQGSCSLLELHLEKKKLTSISKFQISLIT